MRAPIDSQLLARPGLSLRPLLLRSRLLCIAERTAGERPTLGISEVDRLRRRTRADRHATSFPLIALGAIGFHYASLRSPIIPLWYGLPLAFVIVWALQWRNEQLRGVGPGRDDLLIIAFGVFLFTSFVASPISTAFLFERWRLRDAVLYLPSAVGLGTVASRQRNATILAMSVLLFVGLCVASEIKGQFTIDDQVIAVEVLVMQLLFGVMTAVGFLAYRRELAHSNP
jgi:hypothetical protein